TARPQVVFESDNPSYYRILRLYYERTGIPSVLNTSFNMHEEPIVCSPADACRALIASGLPYLAMNRFLVRGRTKAE
ncbi:MAG TPA: carbamoyltransferase C-terminal domain-containing protein, partial [Sandaracinaceae bacterium]